jgi:hypothetical protein
MVLLPVNLQVSAEGKRKVQVEMAMPHKPPTAPESAICIALSFLNTQVVINVPLEWLSRSPAHLLILTC